MHIKTFILGVITGAVALAVIDKVVERQQGQAALARPSAREGTARELAQDRRPEEPSKRADDGENTPPTLPSQTGQAADSELDDSRQGQVDAGVAGTPTKKPQGETGATSSRGMNSVRRGLR